MITNTIQKVVEFITHHVHAFLLATTGLVSTLLLWFSHDFSWWPEDCGVFAYIAHRLNQGAIYGVDIVDTHAGYHAFINASMFDFFGEDVVVMRYPVIILSILGALIIAHLLRRRGFGIAFLGGLSTVTLGYLHFLNPSPNWYCLFFALVSVAILTEYRPSSKRTLILGALVGLCLMFRHPSAIFLGFGILVALLLELRVHISMASKWDVYVTRGVLVIIASSLALYCVIAFEALGFVLFGVWPLLFLALIFKELYVPYTVLVRTVLLLIAGALFSILPMFVYQYMVGDVSSWLWHSFLSGTTVLESSFFSTKSYFDHFVIAYGYFVYDGFRTFAFIKVLYWTFLLVLPVYVGVHACVQAWKKQKVSPIVVVALFFGYVSFYFQIPFYLYISVPLFLLAALHMIHFSHVQYRYILITFLIFIHIHAVGYESALSGYFHKGDGEYAYSTLPGVHVLEPKSATEEYRARIDIIHKYTVPGDEIYVFPFNPDLYFVSQRYTRFPFFVSMFAVTSEEAYYDMSTSLINDPPPLFVFRENGGSLNSYDKRLYETLMSSDRFVHATSVDSFHFIVTQTDETQENDMQNSL